MNHEELRNKFKAAKEKHFHKMAAKPSVEVVAYYLKQGLPTKIALEMPHLLNCFRNDQDPADERYFQQVVTRSLTFAMSDETTECWILYEGSGWAVALKGSEKGRCFDRITGEQCEFNWLATFTASPSPKPKR